MRKTILPEIGTKFFDWKVINNQPIKLGLNQKSINILVECKCGKQVYRQLNGLKRGTTKSCKSCATKIQYREGAYRYFKYPIQKLIGEISGSYFAHIKNGAKYRKIDFNLTMDYLWELFVKQEGKCKLSGLDLYIERSYSHKAKYNNHTASLDRIDSNLGYTEGNVQWVHKKINNMKLNLSNKDFIEFCKIISNYN